MGHRQIDNFKVIKECKSNSITLYLTFKMLFRLCKQLFKLFSEFCVAKYGEFLDRLKVSNTSCSGAEAADLCSVGGAAPAGTVRMLWGNRE